MRKSFQNTNSIPLLKARHVIARFTITVNQRLDGLEEFLDKKSTMTEFGALADIAMDDNVNLAGAKKRDRSQRAFGGKYLKLMPKLICRECSENNSIYLHYGLNP